MGKVKDKIKAIFKKIWEFILKIGPALIVVLGLLFIIKRGIKLLKGPVKNKVNFEEVPNNKNAAYVHTKAGKEFVKLPINEKTGKRYEFEDVTAIGYPEGYKAENIGKEKLNAEINHNTIDRHTGDPDNNG